MRGKFECGGAGFERGEQMSVLDVVSERIEPDLGRVEKDFGRAEQPLGIIDDAKLFQRRGMLQASLPRAKRFQCGDRTRKQRRRPMVGLCRRRDQKRVDAGRGQARWRRRARPGRRRSRRLRR